MVMMVVVLVVIMIIMIMSYCISESHVPVDAEGLPTCQDLSLLGVLGQVLGNVLIIDNTNIRSGRSVTQTIRISSECSPWYK